MFQIENDYETPIESNNYQRNENHFQNPYKTVKKYQTILNKN